MPHLIAVVGLPGSGKSHCVHQQAREHGYVAVSDVTQDRWERWPEVVAAIEAGKTAIIDSATFTERPGRAELLVRTRLIPLADPLAIEWRFFACDPAACLSNILRDATIRPDRELAGRIKSFLRRAARYEVPPGVDVIPVLRPREYGATVREVLEVEIVAP